MSPRLRRKTAAAAKKPSRGKPAKKSQPVGKSDREEELRHDRIGITAIRVVVFEHRRHHLVSAQEVDKEHAHHGVAAKLIQRDDSTFVRCALSVVRCY